MKSCLRKIKGLLTAFRRAEIKTFLTERYKNTYLMKNADYKHTSLISGTETEIEH